MNKVSRLQIKIIHTLKHELGLSDDSYRAMLSAYGASSSTELTAITAAELIAKMQAHVNSKKVNAANDRPFLKYDELGKREGKASPAQLRLIEVLWAQVSRQQTSEARAAALQSFLMRIVGIQNILWLDPSHVKKVVAALIRMKKQALDKKILSLHQGESHATGSVSAAE